MCKGRAVANGLAGEVVQETHENMVDTVFFHG
jgi:hypothetical protein